jgi:hypothetical protein
MIAATNAIRSATLIHESPSRLVLRNSTPETRFRAWLTGREGDYIVTKQTEKSKQNNRSGHRCIAHAECAKAHLSKDELEKSLELKWGEEVRGNRVYGFFKNSTKALNHNRRRGEGEPDVVLIGDNFYVEY